MRILLNKLSNSIFYLQKDKFKIRQKRETSLKYKYIYKCRLRKMPIRNNKEK